MYNSWDTNDRFEKRIKIIFGVWVMLNLIPVVIGGYVAFHFISKWW